MFVIQPCLKNFTYRVLLEAIASFSAVAGKLREAV